MRKLPKRALGIATMTLVIATTLGSSATVRASDDDPNASTHPFRYYLGHEVVIVDVTMTAKTTRRIEVLSGEARKRCLVNHTTASGPPPVAADPDVCVTQTTVTTREGSASSKLVPDPKVFADIRLGSSAFTDDELTIELREGMLLSSINLKSTGRAGDVIASIAKFAGVLVGGFPGLAAQDTTPTPRPPLPGSTCNPLNKPYSDLPDSTRLALWERQQLCDQYNVIAQLQRAVDALVADRLALEHDIRGATGQTLTTLLLKLKTVQDAIKQAEADLPNRIKRFQAQLEVFVTEFALGSTTAVRRHNQVLDLSELPPLSQADKTPFFTHGMSEAAAQTIVNGAAQFTPPVRKLWEAARVIVTLDPLQAVTCPKGDESVKVPTPPADQKQFQIAFRQGTPARITIFLADQLGDTSQGPSPNPPSTLRVVGDKFDNVVHKCSPVTSVIFKRSAWAKRELSLVFDEKGRPVRLQRVANSDVAAIAAAAANGASALRDEIKTTVAAGADIAENRRKTEMSDLTAQLERVKKEKEMLDAQLAVDVAGVNFDTSLRQQQAAATLLRLQADLALASAQSSADQRAEIDQLKLSLDQVKQEIDLLKAQQELEKLRRKD